MNDQLIPVTTRSIGQEIVPTVNARCLHEFLEVGKDFSNWIKDRIESFDFSENQDFVVFTEIGENLKGGRPAKEYAITLDMAKELSMVERNARGKQARQYFIRCEKVATGQITGKAASAQLPKPTQEFKAAYSICRLIGLDKNQSALSANKATIRLTGVNILNVIGHEQLIAEKQEMIFTPTELGKRIGMSGQKFNKALELAGLQKNIDGSWVPTDIGKPFATIIDTDKRHNSGAAIQQVKWTESVVDKVVETVAGGNA